MNHSNHLSFLFKKRHVNQHWMRAIFSCLLTVCIFFLGIMASYATDEKPTHWYCPRAKNHAQPHFGSDLSYVSSYGGFYIDKRHTRSDDPDKVVYLTFDAGYENGNVEKILDVLGAQNVSGAFFILGHLCEANPQLVSRMANEGHLVCNHTFSHKNMTGRESGALTEELTRLEKTCEQTCGVTLSKYFRPPEGTFDRAMLQEADACGYKTIFWSFAYADWDNQKQPDPAAAKQKILENVHNGAVILLHPTSSTNAAILGDVIQTLKSLGYRFGTLDELTQAT